MCNLYRVRKSAAEIAAHFGADAPADIRIPSETKPGEAGVIVRRGPSGLTMSALRWGFPLAQRHKITGALLHPKPVNLVADLTNPMWSEMVQDPRYRCLIPATEFGEPEGPRGYMTRTWFSVTRWPLFAWAGFCRTTPEWGPVYAGMTTDSNDAVKDLNPRMPVLLAPQEYERWLTCGIADVIGFQFRKFPPELLTTDRTDDYWVPRLPKVRSQASLF